MKLSSEREMLKENIRMLTSKSNNLNFGGLMVLENLMFTILSQE